MSEDDKPRGEPAVKAKLPNAKNIRSPEFTPHGISAGRGGGPRPSGLTASQARTRNYVMIAGILVVVVAIAAGGWYLATRPDPEITAKGAFGKEPKVSIPKNLAPATKLKATASIRGGGPKIADGDTVFVKYSFYQWAKAQDDDDSKKKSTNKQVGSSYTAQAQQQGQDKPLVVGKSGVKGLDKGLLGQTAGSRVILEIPPADGFGEQGQQLQLSPTDSLVFVVDVQGVTPKNAGPVGTEKKLDDKDLPKVEAGKPGQAPKVTIPKKVDAPGKLQTKVLVEGNGKALAKGDEALVNYQGQLWKNGKVFDSSWQNGGVPAKFPIGTGGTVPGFDKGLMGQKIGSRVMLVLPPADGYGKNGAPQAGIKGDDTLVFVVDILGTIFK
ncbi:MULTISPECIES: FKBP-type peptidyl-prolyl cis-trans isomerase [Thermomonosporaceae]|uniref:FKBP-type peptidyl-prolyl cis-trans isomerase n=1 Tax=Thermomonosporaceae TaxID=2012 RepID=UPI00255B056D|nr:MULTISPECIES: FKBP-type peptidyl-prolyl cis-trans isomerase [Thermomonosporaceae]MDL4777449.1 FKBP-type peptidyl-prolyl cis-trans isomerase [Actinomadura xylanilytica]